MLENRKPQDFLGLHPLRFILSSTCATLPMESPRLVKASIIHCLAQYAPRYWTQNATAGLLGNEYEEAEDARCSKYEAKMVGRESNTSCFTQMLACT